MRTSILFSLALLVGCNEGWTDGPGDVRLTADAWAWACDFDGEYWVGTQHFFMDLQHAPEQVETRPLPEAGECAVWGSTFARDDLLSGTGFEDVDGFMMWALLNGGSADRVSTGTFQEQGPGFWTSDAYDDHQTCYGIDTVMMDGVEVQNAPSLEGVATPPPGTLTWVTLDTDILNGVPYGTEFTATWEASAWQDQFIVLNRTRSGLTVESIVCNVAGQSTFDADASFWSLSNAATGSDASRFFVAFRNVDKQVSEAGLKVEGLTRGMWSVAITE